MDRPVVLTIAGVDPSGGAGIFADFRAIEAAGARAVGAVTALTVQTENSFLSYEPTPPELLRATIQILSRDLPIAAVKVGMLATGRLAAEVVDLVDELQPGHLVVDPVIVASVGARLVDEEARNVIRTELVRRATLLTPNMSEAALLTGLEVEDLKGMRRAAEALVEMGASAVAVTGGHLEGDAVDVVACDNGVEQFSAPRLPGRVHGTGCAFSSAAAASLAKGLSLAAAILAAKAHVATLFRSEQWRFTRGERS